MVLFFGRRGQSLASSISFSTSQAWLLPREGGEERTENAEQRRNAHRYPLEFLLSHQRLS